MKKVLAIALLVLIFASGQCSADSNQTVTVNLGPLQELQAQELTVPFTNLSDTPLSGQTQTLTFQFANAKWIYEDEVPLFAGVILQTNDSTFPGFATGTGTFIGQNGELLFAPIELGSADASNGSFIVGFTPPLALNAAIYGFQFNITYPDTAGITINGGDLVISGDGAYVTTPEPALPLMLGFGLLCAVALKFRTA